jgi:ABC-type uncharacterized transport system involved in gliding motility auxiliary subunit
MNDNLSQVTGCATGLSCMGLGFLKWFNLVVIPEYLLLGSVVVLTWQLYRMYRSWRAGKPDRSQDGTNY